MTGQMNAFIDFFYICRMNSNENHSLKIAILDLYDGAENQGMRGLHNIIHEFSLLHQINPIIEVFDVRQKLQIPSLDFDLYLSTGGPGSPIDSEGTEWDNKYFQWIKDIDAYNLSPDNFQKKPVFFICHSFQLACRYFKIGKLTKRRSNSFGVFPVHMLEDGAHEPVFAGLSNPFYAVDSRDYQVIEPDYEKIYKLGSKLLAIEKERPHVPLQRAIMAVRFTHYFIGTQFHPEADPAGMLKWLHNPEKKKSIIENHSLAKWTSMVTQLHDPEKILTTYSTVLPNFLRMAMDMALAAKAA